MFHDIVFLNSIEILSSFPDVFKLIEEGSLKRIYVINNKEQIESYKNIKVETATFDPITAEGSIVFGKFLKPRNKKNNFISYEINSAKENSVIAPNNIKASLDYNQAVVVRVVFSVNRFGTHVDIKPRILVGETPSISVEPDAKEDSKNNKEIEETIEDIIKEFSIEEKELTVEEQEKEEEPQDTDEEESEG